MSFSTVIIMGSLCDDPDEDGFRHIRCLTLNVFASRDENVLIPVRYWNASSNNLLLTLKKESKLIVKGRLSKDENHPLYVLVEKIEPLSL